MGHYPIATLTLDLELDPSISPVAGQDIQVTTSLPWNLNALRPTKAVFVEGVHWWLQSLVIGNVEQLEKPVTAAALTEALEKGFRSLHTIQRRMGVVIVARAQKHGLRFHCKLSGPAVFVEL